jgi:hypothetical protein
MPPKKRQAVYWQWADCMLHNRCVEACTAERGQLDIQVRTSRLGAVQLFIGIYSKSGSMVLEEYYPERPGESMTAALQWGEDRARVLSTPNFLLHPRLS